MVMLPNELALIAVLFGAFARQLPHAEQFQEAIPSVAGGHKGKRVEKIGQGPSILSVRDWSRSFYPKVAVVLFPGVKVRAKNPPRSPRWFSSR